MIKACKKYSVYFFPGNKSFAIGRINMHVCTNATLIKGANSHAEKQIWYNLHTPESVGLPKPVQSLLKSLS